MQMDMLIEKDRSNEYYFNTIIENFYEDINTNDEELNEILLAAIESINELNILAEEDLDNAIKNQRILIEQTPKPAAAWHDLCISAMGNYSLGISIIRSKGCPQTATYMEHAIVPMDKVYTSWNPSTFYHNNDSWATSLVRNQFFTNDLFPKFEKQILLAGKNYGTVTGSFAYTTENSSLDAFAALHNVNYSVTFTKKSSGEGYSTAYKITDTYDFAWGNYDNFAIGFGNNYCYAMQSNGWIKPFQIIITYG